MADSILDKKSVCVITGASKGLGKSIALLLAKALPKGSLFILLARSRELLNTVSTDIKKNDGIDAVVAEFDQGSADSTSNEAILKSSLAKAGVAANQFDQAILINNAGKLGPLEFAQNLDQLDISSEYFTVNLAGCVTITAMFLQVFRASDVKSRVIINISSLAAVSPMKSWLLYSMAKAARDMMMKVIAAEEENMRTLNYAPGPLVTEMTTTASEETKDPELRQWFLDSIQNKTLLECEVSTQKLLEILKKNSFENGAHVDYFDEI